MTTKNTKSLLSHSNRWIVTFYSVVAAFGTYSCMYAFRKPFAVATFENMAFLSIDYKIWLITAQVAGYTLSKFLGIKIISELKHTNRLAIILTFICIAECALFLFAVVPAPFNILFLFINGIPLGMVWGIVFSYLEGRRNTEILGAGLCTSFIFSSGLVKSVGKWLMLNFGVGEFMMPFLTGLIFILPLLLFAFMLDQIPDPDEKDKEARTKRVAMTGDDRMTMIREYGLGLLLLVLAYVVLTAFRDFRDNFAAEIWTSLGYGASSDVFTLSEIPISIGVLIIMSLVVLIKSNIYALVINHIIVIFGFFLIGGSTFAFEAQLISPFTWVILVGLGLYLGYVPFNSIFFDRMIAAFRSVGNVGFLIYLADSFGYLGSVGVLFYKNFGHKEQSWLVFFKSGALLISVLGIALMLFSLLFFQLKHKRKERIARVMDGETPYEKVLHA